ncbi:MAG: peptidase S58 family protein [Caldithrix sp.]|nr:peptidase S58 family protein [Caldithrix sp.]
MLDTIKIGHATDRDNGTGCTVILPPSPNITSASVRGASPGSRELALLAPEKKISEIHGLLLTGGSAYGLGGAHQLMLALKEAGRGYQTEYGIVPLIPAAVIFDKNIGNNEAYPTNDQVKEAFHGASVNAKQYGSIGAGTGATVGKWKGINHAMKGGIGIFEQKLGDLKVTVLSVVNAVGDIVNPDGTILAGAINEQKQFYARTESAFSGRKPDVGLMDNTVLTVVMTNALLTKMQAYQVADHAHYGLARAIKPSHTSYDGDTVFAIALPDVQAPLDVIFSLTTDTVEQSIRQSVIYAETLHGVPSVKDLDMD